MKLWARRNHVGWIHLWTRSDGYSAGDPSDHFCNGRIDPLWREVRLAPEQREALERGELVEIDDPGYFPEPDSEDDSSRR